MRTPLTVSGTRLLRACVAASALVLLTACTAVEPAPEPSPTPSASATPSPTPTPTRADLLQAAAPGLRDARPGMTLSKAGLNDSPVTVTVKADKKHSTRWRSTNTGLSFEATDLADPRWEPGESSLDLLIGSLDNPSLRFGGNAVDRRLWWTSSNEKAPKWAEATVTPADLERVGRFLDEVDATATLVLPLGHFDPARAADMGAHAHKIWGDRLVAVSFGNEPNGYHDANQPQLELRDASWGPDAWVKQARATQQALEKKSPGIPVTGPGAYDAQWWRAFGDADLPHSAGLTQHWYPLWSCPDRPSAGDERAAPTVANMVAPHTHAKARKTFTMAREVAASYDLPLFMDETGPTSCPGTNPTSRTLAQALWTVDYAFNGAQHGVHRMNMHSALQACSGGPPMSLLCDREKAKPSADIKGQGNYLALLFAAQVREGRFVPITVKGSKKVFGYAVHHPAGVDVVLVNMADPGTGASPLDLTGVPTDNIVVSLLNGPDLSERKVSMIPLSPTSEVPDRIPAGSAVLIRSLG